MIENKSGESMLDTIILENKSSITVSVMEILSVPYNDETDMMKCQLNDVFLQILNEVNKLCVADTVVLEFLWVSEKVTNQNYEAKIRLFCILRCLSADIEMGKQFISVLTKNILTSLKSALYEVEETDHIQLNQILKSIEDRAVKAIVKDEKWNWGMQTGMSYYYVDIFERNDFTNFEGLINVMCQEPGSAVSFQVFPTAFTQDEYQAISLMQQAVQQFANGMTYPRFGYFKDEMAQAPLHTYNHYAENFNQPIFTYNILVYGNERNSDSIAVRLDTLLSKNTQTGKKTDLLCIDLSEEHICLCEEWIYYPWNVSQLLLFQYRNGELWNKVNVFSNLMRLPYIVTLDEAMLFMRLPYGNENLAGLTWNRTLGNYSDISQKATDIDNIFFGKIEGTNLEVGASPAAFAKHTLITGMPGTGKTTFAIDILLQFYKKGIPFLAIEPTKKEYRAMLDVVPDLQIFTPGNSRVSPFIINPFIPPMGITVEQYIPSLFSAFEATIPMPSPLDVIFLQVINRCYAFYGWKGYSKSDDPDVTPFGFFEFIMQFKKMITKSDYGKEVRGNLESGGVFRLLNLIEQNPNVYDTVHTVPLEDLLKKPTVIELNSIDNVSQKALLMAILLIQICVYTKHNSISDGELKNIIMVDEAHVLFDQHSSQNMENVSQGTAGKTLQDMMAEIRSFGTGIIIADQMLSTVGKRTVANTDLKISFRLVEKEERDIIAKNISMSEALEQRIPQLEVGEAVIHYNKLKEPLLVITPDIRKEKNIRLYISDEEVSKRVTYWSGKEQLLKPFRECKFCRTCNHLCDFRIKADAAYYAKLIYDNREAYIVDEESLLSHIAGVKILIKTALQKYSISDQRALVFCVKVALYRKIQLEKMITVKKEQVNKVLFLDE